MNALVVIFGMLVAVLGVIGLLNPAGLLGFISHMPARWRYSFAIALRVLIGGILLLAAPLGWLPLVLTVLGILALAAAAGLALVGQEKFEQMVTWWLDLPTWAARCSGLVMVLLGILLIVAIWPVP